MKCTECGGYGVLKRRNQGYGKSSTRRCKNCCGRGKIVINSTAESKPDGRYVCELHSNVTYMTRWQVMTCVRNWERDRYYVLVKLGDDGPWMLPMSHSYDFAIEEYYYTRLDKNREPTGEPLQFTL